MYAKKRAMLHKTALPAIYVDTDRLLIYVAVAKSKEI